MENPKRTKEASSKPASYHQGTCSFHMKFKGNSWLWQYLNNTDNTEFLAILFNGLDSDLMELWYFVSSNYGVMLSSSWQCSQFRASPLRALLTFRRKSMGMCNSGSLAQESTRQPLSASQQWTSTECVKRKQNPIISMGISDVVLDGDNFDPVLDSTNSRARDLVREKLA